MSLAVYDGRDLAVTREKPSGTRVVTWRPAETVSDRTVANVATRRRWLGLLLVKMRKELTGIPKAAVPQEEGLDAAEANLVRRAKAGSQEAWTEIYLTHYRPVYRYVKARVFDRGTAEDLTASVFLEALRSIESYRYRGRPLLAWLFHLARNVASSEQRRLLRHQESGHRPTLRLSSLVPERLLRRFRGDHWDSDIRPLRSGAMDDDPAAMAETIEVRDAMKKLTSDQREVLTLRFFVGLNTGEIAGVMGRDPSAIYSLVAHAVLKLHEHLGEDGAGDSKRPAGPAAANDMTRGRTDHEQQT